MAQSAASLVVSLTVGLCLLQLARAQATAITIQSVQNTSAFHGDGTDFSRKCSLTQGATGILEWILNGEHPVLTCDDCNELRFFLDTIEFHNAGEYTCRANLTDGSVLGPESAGFLTVLDPDLIYAPPVQYIILGEEETTLICSTNITGADIVWTRNGQHFNGLIADVSFDDEGSYKCHIIVMDASTEEGVEVKVVVPPEIISSPPNFEEINGSTPHVLRVTFLSSVENVSWYKDGVIIPEVEIFLNDTYMYGETQLNFSSITREDSGVYRVVVESTLPVERRIVETSFEVKVVVYPAIPANVTASNTSTADKVKITWSLTNQNADEAADSLTVTLQYSDRMLFKEYMLSGDETEISVDVEPGMDYWVSVSAHNPDGTKTSTATPFRSQPAVPSISSVEVERLNITAFFLTVTLEYTGGGDITTFTVSFRETGTTEWNIANSVTFQPSSALTWTTVFTIDNTLAVGILEFEVSLGNAEGLESRTAVQEAQVLPGAPTDIILISSTTDALNIEVHLSPEGTPPILYAVIEVTHPVEAAYNISGPFQPGERVQYSFNGLTIDTEYSLAVYAVNNAGRGPSIEETFSTESESSASFPILVVVPVVSGSIIVIVALLVGVCFCYCRKRDSEKNKYYTGNGVHTAEEKTLDPTHEMVNRQRSAGFAALASGPLTPRSPTTYATPSTVSTVAHDSPYNDKFRFESSSNESENSTEVTYPRYTYRVSPSPGEQSLHNSLHSLQLPLKSDSIHSTHETLLSPPPHTPSFATDV